MRLRPRQEIFRDNCIAALNERGNTLGVAPTGAGKTVMLSAIAGKYINDQAKGLIIQHRDELVSQNRKTFAAVNPNVRTGLYTASEKTWRHPATFAMIQTLAREANLKSMPKLDFIAIDEGHHAAAPSYRRAIDAARDANPDLKLLLVTATPNRGDGKALRDVVDNVADQVTLRELISAGLLVRPRTFTIDLGIQEQLRNAPKRAGDFDPQAIGEIMDKEVLNERVIDEWQRLAGDRQTVVFCSTVAHADHVRSTFAARGISAAMIHGDMGENERRRVLASYDRGEIQVITNVAVLTEGWDHQPTSCVILLRQSSYQSTMLQMIGRGLRVVDPERYPGVVKDDCIAEGSLVLTDHGLVPIEKVTVGMKVWDGVDFVSHDGPTCRGWQDTITYCGVTGTPDHKVWTDHGWKTLEECASAEIAIRVTGHGGLPIREACGLVRRDNRSGQEVSPTPQYQVHGMRRDRTERFIRDTEASGRLPQVRKETVWGANLADEALHSGQIPLHYSGDALASLWREGDRVSVQVTDGNGFVDDGQHSCLAGSPDRQNRQRWSLRAWEHSHGSSQDKCQQHWSENQGGCSHPQIQDGASRSEVCGQHAKQLTSSGVVVCSDHGSLPQPEIVKTKRRVWDILNAGPRHRFTVEGLLVSNCIVLDFGTSLLTHGALEQDVKLDGRKKKCEECGASVPSHVKECPICGHTFEAKQVAEPSEGKEPEEKGVLSDFVMTEVDLLADSPFQYEHLFGGIVSMATAFDAWVAVIHYAGRWHAIGGGQEVGMHHLANHSDRLVCLTAGDDFMRENGDKQGAGKTKRWLTQPCTDKQRAYLGLDPMAAMGVTKYQAACQMTWRFNERTIRRILEGSVRRAA